MHFKKVSENTVDLAGGDDISQQLINLTIAQPYMP